MYYQKDSSKFLKIFVHLPKYVNQMRQLFEQGKISYKNQDGAFSSVTFESNMPFALRFMIDNDIVGMQWCQFEKAKYKLRSPSSKMSTCQFEFDVIDFRNVEAVPLSEDSKIAPIRILSFDIECQAEKGSFPLA
jgi:DNA polymerase delta subunit 1